MPTCLAGTDADASAEQKAHRAPVWRPAAASPPRAAGEGHVPWGIFSAVTPLAHAVPSVESCVLSAHTGVLIILYFFFFFFW